MYRGLRAIDVAMMAADITADHTAVDKTVTAVTEEHLAAKIEDVRQIEKRTASQVAWARRESRRARRCGRAHRAARSAAARSARAPPSAGPRAREARLPLGDSMTGHSVIPAHSDLSKEEGN